MENTKKVTKITEIPSKIKVKEISREEAKKEDLETKSIPDLSQFRRQTVKPISLDNNSIIQQQSSPEVRPMPSQRVAPESAGSFYDNRRQQEPSQQTRRYTSPSTSVEAVSPSLRQSAISVQKPLPITNSSQQPTFKDDTYVADLTPKEDKPKRRYPWEA